MLNDLNQLASSTRITFPQGVLCGQTNVLYAGTLAPDKAVLLLEESPFHPVSHTWPDQPGDLGTIKTDTQALEVLQTVTACVDTLAGDRKLYLDREIPVRKNEGGWLFLVAHIVRLPAGFPLARLEGGPVTAVVDAAVRNGLSATHTSTHLAALALNKHTRQFWRKEVPQDALGNPDLDKLAMERSEMSISGCRDHYRLGKSLRKRGCNGEELLARLSELQSRVREQVAAWIATAAPVAIEVTNPTLDSIRYWTCNLDGMPARFPCGGTHLASLGLLESVEITLQCLTDLPEFTMHTVPLLRDRSRSGGQTTPTASGTTD